VGQSGSDVPGEVKRLSLDEFFRLADMAREIGLHAYGRPVWVAKRRAEVVYLFAHPLTWKKVAQTTALRCYVGMVLTSELVAFTMDIPESQFHALESVVDPFEISNVVLNHARFVAVEEG